MNDRELLEKAAKAAGIELIDYCTKVAICFYDKRTQTSWSPLARDGDAFALAVQLNIDVLCASQKATARIKNKNGRRLVTAFTEAHENEGCPRAATRRAIVRAAAAMGEQHD